MKINLDVVTEYYLHRLQNSLKVIDRIFRSYIQLKADSDSRMVKGDNLTKLNQPIINMEKYSLCLFLMEDISSSIGCPVARENDCAVPQYPW